MVISLDVLVATLEKLKKGEEPVIPSIAPIPIVLHEPEVKIVEVSLNIYTGLFLMILSILLFLL